MRMSGNRFRRDNHCLQLDFPTITDWIEYKEVRTGLWALGWCPGPHLEYRPDSKYHGMMVEDEEGRMFWSHVLSVVVANYFPDALSQLRTLELMGSGIPLLPTEPKS